MKSFSKLTSFTRQMFIRQYIPALASAFVLALADMADALFVGIRMGARGIAAIAFSLPIFMLYNVIMHSFGLGGCISFSKSMTSGDEKGAKSSFQGVITFLLVLGILIAVFGNIFLDGVLIVLGADQDQKELFAAAGLYLRILFASAPFFFFGYSMGYYMRNDDMEKEASLCSGVGNTVDFSLNVILVLLLDQGVRGAAFATLSGVVITGLLQTFFVIKNRSHLTLFPFMPDFSKLLISFKTGLSSCVTYIYSFIYIWLGNYAMMRLVGEIGVAVFDMVQNISNVVVYLFSALNMSAQPITSTYEGEHNYEECDNLQTFLTEFSCISGIIKTIIIVLAAPLICKAFGINVQEGYNYGSMALRIYSTAILFVGINMVYSNYYTSREIYAPAFFISTIRGAVILLPVTFFCIFLGKNAFWFSYPVTEVLSFFVIRRYTKVFTKTTKRLDADRIFTATLADDLGSIGGAVAKIEEFCEKWDANPKQIYYSQMTVEEMCNAIIVNGFKKGNVKDAKLTLTLVALPDNEFSLHIRDNAISFDPFNMNKKNVAELDDSASDFNALGMDVIKNKAKSFYYRRYQGFNTMVVKI